MRSLASLFPPSFVQGYNEFSLLSLSCSDYLALPSVGIQIKNRLRDDNVALSLPSQRVDRFDESIANIVANSAKRSGLTFAPEAGTQRLRDIINKGERGGGGGGGTGGKRWAGGAAGVLLPSERWDAPPARS